MAIAPLIMTIERETVIDFSKSFLSFNLKGIHNAQRQSATIFSFLRPLSKETWVRIILSLLTYNLSWELYTSILDDLTVIFWSTHTYMKSSFFLFRFTLILHLFMSTSIHARRLSVLSNKSLVRYLICFIGNWHYKIIHNLVYEFIMVSFDISFSSI